VQRTDHDTISVGRRCEMHGVAERQLQESLSPRETQHRRFLWRDGLIPTIRSDPRNAKLIRNTFRMLPGKLTVLFNCRS